ncbi:hypothetical protein [Pseudonocardia nigra]|uniref:hypothetical protein n=1 Tax=Pseudonocardia nigra TaxID=1921578 RepID=UPI001C5F7648|nr:hypothetical protein [Pseudonocardia nigra]
MTGGRGRVGGPGVPVWVRTRRRAGGPRPVRPVVVPVSVRPAQLERPVVDGVPVRSGQRVLVRTRTLPAVRAMRVRRVLTGLAVTAAGAAVVVALGLMASFAADARAGAGPYGVESGPGVVTVRVGEPGTVWDVAREMAPAAPGVEVGELAERIVTDNALPSVQLYPGQVLRVTVG